MKTKIEFFIVNMVPFAIFMFIIKKPLFPVFNSSRRKNNASLKFGFFTEFEIWIVANLQIKP